MTQFLSVLSTVCPAGLAYDLVTETLTVVFVRFDNSQEHMENDRHDLPNEPDLMLINKALEVVSGKWRLYIILLLGEKTLRYSKLSELLPGVSEKVLAGELKALVALGVMKRQAYPEIPPRVEYTLTQQGLSALPMLKQIQEIGQVISRTY